MVRTEIQRGAHAKERAKGLRAAACAWRRQSGRGGADQQEQGSGSVLA